MRPGTDAALALGFHRVIIEEELYDKEFVEQHITGWDAFVARVTEDYSLDRVEAITWVDRDLIREGWAPLWVVDFPMFERASQAARWTALHHPFTAPAVDDAEALRADPGNALSRAYDMVLNGSEVGGGSFRIHDQDMQSAVFELLDISAEEAEEKFGFLLRALQYGAPPHGGIAFGFDRLVMLMCGQSSIRDVIAFPKTQRAACLLTSAPSETSKAQLDELYLKVKPIVS